MNIGRKLSEGAQGSVRLWHEHAHESEPRAIKIYNKKDDFDKEIAVLKELSAIENGIRVPAVLKEIDL